MLSFSINCEFISTIISICLLQFIVWQPCSLALPFLTTLGSVGQLKSVITNSGKEKEKEHEKQIGWKTGLVFAENCVLRRSR